MSLSVSKLQRAYRIRIAVFLACAAFVVIVLDLGDQTIQAIRIVAVGEHERDLWQRPERVIAPLNVKAGSDVAEIGCGAGYFALKLAPVVGSRGRVVAEDILRKPLVLLWIRALLRRQSNLYVLQGESDDPHLPATSLDAVLIANTYHEFNHPHAVIGCTFHALRPGGRLVVLDRGPPQGEQDSAETEAKHHEVVPAAVENELRKSGFEVLSRQDTFIDKSTDRPGDRLDKHSWWLIVARKP